MATRTGHGPLVLCMHGFPDQPLIVPGAGHWVHQEAPEIVNRLVLDFLRA